MIVIRKDVAVQQVCDRIVETVATSWEEAGALALVVFAMVLSGLYIRRQG
jgi:hypothetical protein